MLRDSGIGRMQRRRQFKSCRRRRRARGLAEEQSKLDPAERDDDESSREAGPHGRRPFVGRHPGGALSRRRACSVDPSEPRWPQRDRFILSKGHGAAAYYSTLAARGFFPIEQLKTYMDPLSMLNGHPDRNKLPGVEANTGPLGHGLPIAVGAALAARMRKESWRVFVLTGDGELQEGSNWEAAMTAQHYGLDNLTRDRGSQPHPAGRLYGEHDSHGAAGGDALRAFGFAVEEIDGHSTDGAYRALVASAARKGQALVRHRATPSRAKAFRLRRISRRGITACPPENSWRTAAKELGVEVAW